jgi:CubicO group peptidase (beta-lactamase class C family)
MWTTRRDAVASCTRRTLVTAMAVLIAGCTGSSEPSTIPAEPSTTVVESTVSSNPSPFSAITLGEFPAFPEQPFSERVAVSLQGVIDEAVEEFGGISVAVIVGNAGHWSGASGVDLLGNPLTAGSTVQIASIAKTVTAAQVLRLVEEGAIGLDPAADHLPPELDGYDANGATIRDLLGMRSCIEEPESCEGGMHHPRARADAAGAGVAGRLELQLPERELRAAQHDHRARDRSLLRGGARSHRSTAGFCLVPPAP